MKTNIELSQQEKFTFKMVGVDRYNEIFQDWFGNESYTRYMKQFGVEKINGYDWERKNLKHKYGSINKDDIYVDDFNNIKLKDDKILYFIDWVDNEDSKHFFNRSIEKSVFYPILYKDIHSDYIGKKSISFKDVKLKYTLYNPYEIYNNYLFCHTPETYSSVPYVDDVYRLFHLGVFDERIVNVFNMKNTSRRDYEEYLKINGDFKRVNTEVYTLYEYGYGNDVSYSWCSNLERYKYGWNKKKQNKLKKDLV